jgi:DNA-directed RNA polymerase specialized sigma24 family protein
MTLPDSAHARPAGALPPLDPQSTAALLDRVRSGDDAATNRVLGAVPARADAVGARAAAAVLPDTLASDDTFPLERAIGVQNTERFEAALERLRPEDREAIFSRLELQYSCDELAVAPGKPTANAARVAVMRACIVSPKR